LLLLQFRGHFHKCRLTADLTAWQNPRSLEFLFRASTRLQSCYEQNILIAGFIGIMVALGIFVNGLFLLAAGFGLCGLMHLFGHHGGKQHTNHSVAEEKDTVTN